jgi:NTP pyrophosphatase (non-canonical NTP hydrolase)
MQSLQSEIKIYLEERGWNKLRPGDLAKSVSIEAAELLELFQWANPELDEVKNNPELLVKVKKELADVLIYAFDMGILLGMDIESIMRDKLEHAKKKYPAELMKQDIDPQQSGSAYQAIKKTYRQSGQN